MSLHHSFTVDSSHWSLFRLECAEYDCGHSLVIDYTYSTPCVGSELDTQQPAYGNATMHTEDWNTDDDRFGIDEELLSSEPDLTFQQWLRS